MDAVSSSTDSSASSYFQEMVQRRQMQQAQRIAQGVQSGQLSESEANRLAKQQSRIDQMDQKAMADGSMDSQEFAKIMHAQNKSGHHIYGLKHNAATASDPTGTGGVGAAASNALLSPSASSNASTLGSTVAADMNKLFQDIIQFRQDRQALRIQEGVDSGQLTTDEQQKLTTLEATSADQVNKAKADGNISPLEFANIVHAQNVASRYIHHYRHNNQFVDQSQAASALSGTTSQAASTATTPQNYKPLSVSV
ncbi:hypothetical protein [Fundidesulfovibrio terrae]|uniref:hypothetical protein n=1 Tax=Fundidesulfovibrio terrae TaxID=2922866 RepID=UPI001FAF8BA6|nr:hypothetical protein [Fundidesulfovibrio terrae]